MEPAGSRACRCFCLSKARENAVAPAGSPAELEPSELQAMSLKAVKIRAADVGVGAEAIADADDWGDAEQIKAEVIRLILRQQDGRRREKEAGDAAMAALRLELGAVSYTHLTLPTICSV